MVVTELSTGLPKSSKEIHQNVDRLSIDSVTSMTADTVLEKEKEERN